MAKSYEIDMCNGPLTYKIIKFTFPLMLSSILQLLFNAADVIVVGRFAGSQSLAAVGSTGPIINLLVNLFMGLSIGANVVVARAIGSRKESDISDTVHTSMLLSVISGMILTIIGIPISRPLLILMSSPEDVINLSALYLKIYFAGTVPMLIFNFGSAILRASGDTKRPLYYLAAAGVLNIVLNLFFVIVFHMGVAGVALATVISQILSSFLIVRCLIKCNNSTKLILKKLKIHKMKFRQIFQIGLPASIQSMVFSLSNIVVQSAINSFGSYAMAGSAAAGNIEGFVYVGMNAFHQSSLTFTGQNMGAGKTKRILNIAIICLSCVSIFGLISGNVVYIMGNHLLGIYSTDADVIAQGLIRMKYVCKLYFLCGVMDVTVGLLRGMGYSIIPMITSLLGACILRLIWIATVFRAHRSLDVLFMSYPITWCITFIALIITFIIVYKKQKNIIQK